MLYGTIAVKNKQWNISITTNPLEQMQGLGGLSDLSAQSGMLFDLGSPQTIQVTTVPMLFPLDIVFFSETLEITEIYRDVHPGYLVTSTSPARYFLEVNAGEFEGIGTGDGATVEVIAAAQTTAPDWASALFGFIGFMVIGMLTVNLVKDLVKGTLEGQSERQSTMGRLESLPHVRVAVAEKPESEETVWARFGDVSDYFDFGTPYHAGEGVGMILADYLTRYPNGKFSYQYISAGVEIAPAFIGRNYVSLFWGDKNAQWIRDLSTEEKREFERGIKETLAIPYAPKTENAMRETEVMKYRVEKNEPYDTWAIVELWPGGTVRTPFESKEVAIKREEEIGEYYGWKLKRAELTKAQEDLLDPQRFPKRREALDKLRGYDVVEVHDDGDLTVRSRGKLYVVTTEGQMFEQTYQAKTKSGQMKPRVIPVERPKTGKSELEYFADSPEYLTQTIDDIGYRTKIDNAFQEAIQRAKGTK